VAAQTPSQAVSAQLPSGVSLQIEANPQRATVGDPLQIDISLTTPKGYEVQIPDPGRRIGDFDVLQFFPGPQVQDQHAPPPADGSVYRARIVAAVYRTGEFEFPPLSIVLRDPARRETTVMSPAVKIRIESVLSEGAQDLKDLKKQVEIAEPVRWWPYFGLAAILLAALAVLYWFKRQQKHPLPVLPAAPQRDPLELAEEELRALLGRGLLEKGLVKQFYVALTDVTKRVLEAGYKTQTLEKTTSEIVENLRQSVPGGSGASSLERIETFLISCDLVKFAKYIPSTSENDEAVKEAFEILGECRKARAELADHGVAVVSGTS
jgi:hypothetical protein